MAAATLRADAMAQSSPPYASSSNHRQAQLGDAYASLSKELGTETLKMVGGYTLGRVIGEGTFGSVHLATHRLTGTKCAIKKIPKSATAQLTREIHHHRRMHHPHIVHLFEIVATEQNVWLVSELCSGGELYDYLVERGRLLENEARRLFGELCVAVGWLHKQGVVHRDLKLENVLLDGEMRVKLGDLGFAREWQRGKLMETFCGTTGYASPEMLACQKYLGIETDLWSLGVILYTLLCGGLPFDDDDERTMKGLIARGEYEEPDWLTAEARSLIRGLLHVDPNRRLGIEAVLQHEWFRMDFHSPPATPNPAYEAGPGFPRVSPLAQSLTATSAHNRYSSDEAGSEATSPTSVEEDYKPPDRNHSGEFSQTEQELELLHKNASEATITRLSNGVLPSVNEEDVAPIDQSLQLPLALNSRTPSRTKRRSVSSQLSLERRHSHHSVSGQVMDYLSLLKKEQVPLFALPSEKHLLKGLTALGLDVGQLMYSVSSDACDVSSAMWWIMRAKQVERGETDEAVDAMNKAAARRRDKAAAFAREEKRRAKDGTLDASAAQLPQLGAPVLVAPQAASSLPRTPPRDSTDEVYDLSPKDRLKARSPSMSMLQRATSALTGKKSEGDEGRISPTKLVKPKPQTSNTDSPASLRTVLQTTGTPGSSSTVDVKSNTNKRDSLWNAFRHMFADDRRWRKRDNSPLALIDDQIKIAPTVILTRGPAARGPHVGRIPIANRRGSLDIRPNLQSRRSSSANSRRSSITSIEVPLTRRRSRISHGSQTPTSDTDHASRADSTASLRANRRSSTSINIRSPSIHSDTSTRHPPASPLHNYQRRTPAGSNSTRVRHFKVIPEPQILRSSSVASSIRSNTSSRRSSLERGDAGESDYDTGRDDLSVRSLRQRLGSVQVNRTRSPLMHSLGSKPKAPIRDVFQTKQDDEWVDEDEYQGGLGQAKSKPSRKADHAAAQFPRQSRRKAASSKMETDMTSRRAGVERMGKPPQVIEEEEEEE